MIDANSTFMSVERSRSGIGQPGFISPPRGFGALQNQNQLSIFNNTISKNLRGRNYSNLNQANAQELNMATTFNITHLSP